MRELRPYQVSLRAALYKAMREGKRRPLVVLPTGGGKTVVATHIIADAHRKGLRCAFLVHRKELVDQAYEHLSSAGLHVGVIRSDDARLDASAQVQVVSVQTMARRPDAFTPDLVIHDEAHRAVSPQHLSVLDRWPEAWIIGITATPCRQDGRGLRTVFNELVRGPTMDELIALGALSPARVVAARAAIDTKGISTTAGDYDRSEIRERTLYAVADVVRLVREHGQGRRFIAFALDRDHSRGLATALTEAGVRTEHVDGVTPRAERDAIFARFRSGEIVGVSNVDLVTEGFDVPACDAVLWARATKSLRVFLQGNGRALRASPGKADGLILDAAGNVERLGWPTETPLWSLDDGAGEGKKKGAVSEPLIMCQSCFELWRRYEGLSCPRCGWQFEPPYVEPPPPPKWRELTREEVSRRTGLQGDDASVTLHLAKVARLRGYKPAWISFAAADRGIKLSFQQAQQLYSRAAPSEQAA